MATERHLQSIILDRQSSPQSMRNTGTLHVVAVRSDKAHARIIRLKAPDLPESVVFIDASHLAEGAALRIDKDAMPILASDYVHYVGQPLGLLVGPDKAELLELRGEIRCTYEELPALFGTSAENPENNYRRLEKETPGFNAAFSSAEQVVTTNVQTGLQEHFYADPHSAYARPTPDGRLELTVATQWLHHVRETAAAALGLGVKSIRVHGIEAGPTLEGKVWFPSLLATHAAVAAHVTGRPCLVQYNRAEDLLVSPKRPAGSARVRSAIGPDGTLAAADFEIRYDGGAFPIFSEEMVQRLLIAATGVYHLPEVRISVRCVITNTVPSGPASGMDALAWFAAERWADTTASATGMNPLDFRMAHLVQSGIPTHLGETIPDVEPIRALVDRACRLSDYPRKYAAFELQRKQRGELSKTSELVRGIGLSICSQGSGFSGHNESRYASSMTLRLDQDGHAWIHTSGRPSTSVIPAAWRDRVADVLGIDPDSVHISAFDTETTPDSGPSMLSRVSAIHTRLLEQCVQSVRKKRFQKPLPIEVTRSVRRQKRSGWDNATLSGAPYPERSWAACVVEVQCDPVTIETQITGIWMTVDAGRLIDSGSARHSLATSAVHAANWAGREAALVSPRTAADPSGPIWFSAPFRHEPPVEISLSTGSNSSSALGIGELPFGCVPSAYASAVGQAVNAAINRIPNTAGRLFATLEPKLRAAGEGAET